MADKLWSHEIVSRNVTRVNVDTAGNKKWECHFLLRSDVHHDNPKCDWELEKQHLDEAVERKAGIMDFGDTFCAMQGKWDKRSDKNALRPEHQNNRYLDSLVTTAADFYQPYASNFILFGDGNHETAIKKRHETDLLERLCGTLYDRTACDIHHGGYSGWVWFTFNRGEQRLSRRLWYIHGYAGGGQVTKDRIQAQRQQTYVENADIMVSGHCFDDETEVLTPTGWKDRHNLVIGSEVMTLNRSTGRLEPNAVSAVHVYYDYDNLVTLNDDAKGTSVNLAVTEKHGLWMGKPSRDNGHRLPWQDCEWDTYTASEASTKGELWIRNAGIEANDGVDLSDDQVSLLAWIIAEGHCEAKNGQIRITQGEAKDGRIDVLESHLDGAVSEYTKSHHAGGKHTNLQCFRYTIRNNSQEWEWIGEYITRDKTIRPLLHRMNHWQRRLFLDTYILADGSVDKKGASTGFQIASNRTDHIDFLQHLCVRTGIRTTVSSNNGMHYLHGCEREATFVTKQNWSTTRYAGAVWCVTVPNSTLVVRRRGRTAITMNTHDAWVDDSTVRIYLNNQGRVERRPVTYAKLGTYKDAYADGGSGWEVETGKCPKPLGQWWLRFYWSSRHHTVDYELTRAK